MKTNLLIYILILNVATACGDYFKQEPLLIQNTSSKRIFHWYSKDYPRYHFPDTLLPAVIPVFFGETAPNNKNATGSDNPDWVNVYAKLPSGKLSVYFFKSKPISQQQWELIVNNPDSVYRKDVTFDELKATGYTITYP